MPASIVAIVSGSTSRNWAVARSATLLIRSGRSSTRKNPRIENATMNTGTIASTEK